MFYFLYYFDVESYADDSTPHCVRGLKCRICCQLLRAIVNNSLSMAFKVKTGKVILELELRLTIVILNRKDEQVLLGIIIDSNLAFESHINSFCKKQVKG